MNKLELYHHGIKGMRWGVRRFQNEDGSLTDAGEKRYSKSLSNIYDRDDEDEDYAIAKGTSLFRRTQDSADENSGKKYTYAYDYDDSRDNDFYKQFGRKITEYSMENDAVFAGKKTLGKSFVEKMLSLDDEDDIENMDTLYYDSCKRSGKEYVEDLFSIPYEPQKHVETLTEIGADMVSRMLASQRHESLDAKLQKKGLRDPDTAVNDIGRSIVDKLLGDGYSGMRDYNDYGSSANVRTPTIVFDPDMSISKLMSWVED